MLIYFFIVWFTFDQLVLWILMVFDWWSHGSFLNVVRVMLSPWMQCCHSPMIFPWYSHYIIYILFPYSHIFHCIFPIFPYFPSYYSHIFRCFPLYFQCFPICSIRCIVFTLFSFIFQYSLLYKYIHDFPICSIVFPLFSHKYWVVRQAFIDFIETSTQQAVSSTKNETSGAPQCLRVSIRGSSGRVWWSGWSKMVKGLNES